MPKPDLFTGTAWEKPPRQKPRVMAHVADAGVDSICFECPQCGWESGWIDYDFSLTEAKRGIPCENCNKESNHEQKSH